MIRDRSHELNKIMLDLVGLIDYIIHVNKTITQTQMEVRP